MKKQLPLIVASLICFTAYGNSSQNLNGAFDDYYDYQNNSECDYQDYSVGCDYQIECNIQEDDQQGFDDPIDFESMIQDFVLETKKIEFPEYPGAFNPSIVKWRGALLMSFRIYNPNNRRSANPFAIVQLNNDFEPINTPQVFELPFHNPVLPSKQQDPRLITVGDRLFVVYNNLLENVTDHEMRRMCFSELFYNGEKFTSSKPEFLIDFEGKNDLRYEKNWVPFDYNGELMLGYSLLPHCIFHPIFGTGACETVASTQSDFSWDWGVPRGGTQALLDGDHYLAFFHSWKDLPSAQSNGRKISHYVMGAYTFQAHPPFAITAMSPEPIVAENFYRPPYHRTWKPMRCVFPAGMIINENDVWISYGRQDHEIWIAKLDKEKLLQSLVPVTAE